MLLCLLNKPTSTQTDSMMPKNMQPQKPLAAAGQRSSLSAQEQTGKKGVARISV